MAIRHELVEELLAGLDRSEVFTLDGSLDEMKKTLAERMLNAELDQHLAVKQTGVFRGLMEMLRLWIKQTRCKVLAAGE